MSGYALVFATAITVASLLVPITFVSNQILDAQMQLDMTIKERNDRLTERSSTIIRGINVTITNSTSIQGFYQNNGSLTLEVDRLWDLYIFNGTDSTWSWIPFDDWTIELTEYDNPGLWDFAEVLGITITGNFIDTIDYWMKLVSNNGVKTIVR
ncbi:MAG: hypothetical protein INQ03_15765 [Candidatus Heimdallarchaeota archaeon]|nr:hypothetical protein [Candidatus Heimdallarchaeota archaeon]